MVSGDRELKKKGLPRGFPLNGRQKFSGNPRENRQFGKTPPYQGPKVNTGQAPKKGGKRRALWFFGKPKGTQKAQNKRGNG